MPFTLIPAPNAQGVIAHVQGGTADLGFLAYEEARAREVEFAGPFAVMYNTHLVRADSPLRSVEDADRDGITDRRRARADAGDLPEREPEAGARPDARESAAHRPSSNACSPADELDAIAQNTQRAAEAVAAAGTRVPLRALTGSYVAVEQSFVVKKGDTANAAMLDRFVDELRASGFIRASLDRAQLASVGRGAGTAQMSADDPAPRISSRGARFSGASARPARSPPCRRCWPGRWRRRGTDATAHRP